MPVKCRLSVILAEKEMKLKELHHKTGLNYSYLSDIKRGRTVPGVDNALKIAKALNRTVEEIWVLKEK